MFLDSINLSQFMFSLDLLKGFPLLYSGYDGSFQQLWVGQAPGGPSALATGDPGGSGGGQFSPSWSPMAPGGPALNSLAASLSPAQNWCC